MRDTAYRFADYAMLVFDALQRPGRHLDHAERAVVLGDARLRVRRARPGPARLRRRPSHAVHHLLLGHGLATQRMRAAATAPIDLGITLNLGTADPATDSRRRPRGGPAGRRAGRADLPGPAACTAATRRTSSPTWPRAGVEIPVAGRRPGDHLARRSTCSASTTTSARSFSGVDEDGQHARTPTGYPVERGAAARPAAHRDGLGDRPGGLHRPAGAASRRDYPGLPIVITENGAAFDDEPDADRLRRRRRPHRRTSPPTSPPSPTARAARAPTSAATSPGR